MTVTTETFTGSGDGCHYNDSVNCIECDKTLTGKQRKFCGKRCNARSGTRRYRTRNPWVPKPRAHSDCVTCGESLEGLRSVAKFCSVKCQEADRLIRDRAKRHARILAAKPPCEVCGGALPLWGKRWCSEPCQSRAERLRQYDLTQPEYEALLAAQNGKCAICAHAPVRPHVDHDHKTGMVRGILCFSCNTGLGSFKDDPQRIRSALTYLERALCP